VLQNRPHVTVITPRFFMKEQQHELDRPH
jgi:hypothetical protein